MKLAVCVKEVPEASARTRIDPGTLRLDRSGAAALNPFDAHALEEALRIREADGEGEVVAIMVAPARAAESLRKALAIGADRAVHVADDALAGSDLVATARALGKARRARGSRTSSSSASRAATRTGPSSGRRSPTCCGCPSSRRLRASSSTGARSRPSARPSTATT